MSLALITGGTSGIGYAFALAYARRGFDLVLVSRDEVRGRQVCTDLADQYHINAEFLAADLSLTSDVDRVVSWLGEHPVTVLVNSAGFGMHGGMALPENEEPYRNAIQVMCLAVMRLSAVAARTMAETGHGHIINIASASAWIMQGNYSAVKVWVLRYTEGLAIELEGTGVSATAVCPGWVHTEFHQRAKLSANLPGFVWIPASTVAETAIRDAERGKPVSIPTLKWKVALAVAEHLPRRTLRWVSKKFVAARKKDHEQ